VAGSSSGGATCGPFVTRPHPPPEPPSLLWPEKDWRPILDSLSDSRISLVGVEGRQVRARLSRRVYAELRRGYRPCAWLAYANIFSQVEMARVLGSTSSDAWVIAESCDAEQEARPFSLSMRDALRRCTSALTRSGSRMVMFVPAAWTDDLDTDDTASDLKTLALGADVCMGPGPESYVMRWLSDRLRSVVSDPSGLADEQVLQQLADKMLSDAGPPTGNALDWLHETLDVWYWRIRQDAALRDAENEPFGLPDCSTIWGDVQQAYTSARAETAQVGVTIVRTRSRTPPRAAREPVPPPREPKPPAPGEPEPPVIKVIKRRRRRR